MPEPAVERFWRQVQQDERLQSRLAGLRAKTLEDAIDAIAKIAAEAGIELTPEAIAAALEPGQAELSEGELDRVTGGATSAPGPAATSFVIRLPGSDQIVGAFRNVEGLDSEIDVVEYRNGSDMPVRRRPPRP